jgi:hypothetical protein
MTYSFALINGTLLLGQSMLGLSAGFRGNGMCFSTRGLQRHPWRTFGLVEDLEYSWSLRIAGEKIGFVPGSRVHAIMLDDGGQGAADQRRRWEFGRLQLKRRLLLPLLHSPNLGWTQKLACALDLLMPPLLTLSGLLLVSLLSFAGAVMLKPAVFADPVARFTLALQVPSLIGLLLYASVPFLRFSLGWKVLFSLIQLPAYTFWKLSTLLQGPPRRWIRTARQQAGLPPTLGTRAEHIHMRKV